eukprot:scaffold368254_cov94-Attheya_sp.AAC.1
MSPHTSPLTPSTRSTVELPEQNMKKYPPNVFLSDNGDLLSSFLSLPQFNNLLSNNIDNVAFLVFEEITDQSTKSLSNMGSMSIERWSRTTPRLHCIIQNSSSSGMYYVARTANVCHYQVHMRSFIKRLLVYEGGKMEVRIYNPTQDYQNDFLVVGNSVEATSKVEEHTKWDHIPTVIENQDVAS